MTTHSDAADNQDRMTALRVLALEHKVDEVNEHSHEFISVLTRYVDEQSNQIEQLNEDVRVLQQLVEVLLGDGDEEEEAEEGLEDDFGAFLLSIIG